MTMCRGAIKPTISLCSNSLLAGVDSQRVRLVTLLKSNIKIAVMKSEKQNNFEFELTVGYKLQLFLLHFSPGKR